MTFHLTWNREQWMWCLLSSILPLAVSRILHYPTTAALPSEKTHRFTADVQCLRPFSKYLIYFCSFVWSLQKGCTKEMIIFYMKETLLNKISEKRTNCSRCRSEPWHVNRRTENGSKSGCWWISWWQVSKKEGVCSDVGFSFCSLGIFLIAFSELNWMVFLFGWIYWVSLVCFSNIVNLFAILLSHCWIIEIFWIHIYFDWNWIWIDLRKSFRKYISYSFTVLWVKLKRLLNYQNSYSPSLAVYNFESYYDREFIFWFPLFDSELKHHIVKRLAEIFSSHKL